MSAPAGASALVPGSSGAESALPPAAAGLAALGGHAGLGFLVRRRDLAVVGGLGSRSFGRLLAAGALRLGGHLFGRGFDLGHRSRLGLGGGSRRLGRLCCRGRLGGSLVLAARARTAAALGLILRFGRGFGSGFGGGLNFGLLG